MAKQSKEKKAPESLKSDLALDPKRIRASAKSGSRNAIFLLGFDTEYEKVETEDPEEAKSNRVLSYQYCGTIVDEWDEAADVKWSGILYPKGPAIADRLSIPEFLHAVLEDGIAKHPTVTFPSKIYLIAHFTRADVPGFLEFKDEQLRDRLLLQNIRNLFMNLNSFFDIEFLPPNATEAVKLQAAFRDTMTLAPTGLRSLDALGKLLGVEKIKLSDDPEREHYYKTHMSQLLADDRALFERYAIRDAEICAAYAAQMIRASVENLDSFTLPRTLSSKGLQLLKKYWADNNVDSLDIVGKEAIYEDVWSRARNRIIRQKRIVFVQQLSWNEQFLTEAYHGGRNEQFWFGPAPEAIWYDYDLASAYPSAMTLIGTPDWRNVRTISDTETLLSDQFTSADLLFANVNFEFPETVRYPVLPVRTSHGLIFPRKGNTTTHISEIRLAHRLGCKIDVVEAKYVKSIGGGDPDLAGGSIRPFADFSKFCVDKRNTYAKGTLQNLMWKEIVNSTYGKTAQGLRERRVYDLRDAETKLLPPSDITNPAYAAFITAFCRGVLGEIMNALPPEVSIFSVTTDGFLTTASPDQMQAATNGDLCQFYRRARTYLSGKSDIYEVKHIIRRPIGWRTRGQATLAPSQPEDWTGADARFNEEGSLVLAKADIKLNSRLSKREQNQEILEKIANRKPGGKLTYIIISGPRPMYVTGSDLVDVVLEKKLSMEFDWKRWPTNPIDADVNGTLPVLPRHLSFETVPWDDVRQFNKVRDAWDGLRNTNPICLKSVQDLKIFANYFENVTALEGKAATYLRQRDGALSRLRQQIAIAQKFLTAGTHVHNNILHENCSIRSDAKLTAIQFAAFLTHLIGIETKPDDIANARRKKVFTLGQVPNTAEVRKKLADMKRLLFPDLRIADFLPEHESIGLVWKAK
jgi:hypothetical protein